LQLPDQLIVQHFEPYQSWWWTPPELTDVASPLDLAALLISYRGKLAEIRRGGGRPTEFTGALSDSALKLLLTFAYRMSFLKEESRTVRACLYAPPSRELDEQKESSTSQSPLARVTIRYIQQQMEAWTNHFTLAPPLPLDDPKVIARLAPTLVAEDAVLLVKEEESNVHCVGISLLDRMDSEKELLEMPRWWRGNDGLFVQIVGPGELRVSEGSWCEYTLRANEIRIYQSTDFVEPIRSWYLELANSFLATCSVDPDWEAEHIGPRELAVVDFIILWSRVLRHGVQLNHGGAFIVVPDAGAAPVTLKYRVQLFDLGEELRQAWLSVCRVWRTLQSGKKDRILDVVEDKRRRIHKLCSASRSIGQLCATDGCVLLDRRLTLHGFGGEIAMREVPLKRCVRVQGKTQQDVSEDELLQPFGHRHKSAYSLCKQVANSLAFVISQDGDLRVFASDESTVYLYDLLHP
jgi:hypothetical protein